MIICRKLLAKFIAGDEEGIIEEAMNIDKLKALTKTEIMAASKNLNADEIRFLIQTLNEKDDTLRYNAFLLLQANSRLFPFVYEFWSYLEAKLESTNSYQRSLGAMLIAENVKWDKTDQFDKSFNNYISCCNDEKFITARQTVQGLEVILKATDRYDEKIKQNLTSLSLSQYKENQQKLLKKDKDRILKIIENRQAK
jgi:hypothetical protein